MSRGKDCCGMGEKTRTRHPGFGTHVKVRMLDLPNVPLEREATRTASPRTTVKRTIHDISSPLLRRERAAVPTVFPCPVPWCRRGVVGAQRLWRQSTEVSPFCLFLTDAVTQRAFVSARTGESHWHVTSLVLLYRRERRWARGGGRKRARLISASPTVKRTLNATAETLLTRVGDRPPTSLMELLCLEYLASFGWLSLLVANSIWATLRNMATNSWPLHFVAFPPVLCPALYLTHFFSQKLKSCLGKSLSSYTKPTEFPLLHPRSLPPTCSLREPPPFWDPVFYQLKDALFCIMAFLPGLLHSSFSVWSFVL